MVFGIHIIRKVETSYAERTTLLVVFFVSGLIITAILMSFLAIRILVNKNWQKQLVEAEWNLPAKAIGYDFSIVILKLIAIFILASVVFTITFGTYLLVT